MLANEAADLKLKNVVLTEQTKEQKQIIRKLEPKANAFSVIGDGGAEFLNLRDSSKYFYLPQSVFVDKLLRWKWLYRDKSGKLKAYERIVAQGLIEVRAIKSRGAYRYTLVITGKGLTKLAASEALTRKVAN